MRTTLCDTRISTGDFEYKAEKVSLPNKVESYTTATSACAFVFLQAVGAIVSEISIRHLVKHA